ncbi:MAG: PSD1 and planctomycete cytochrome C domain-containing protein [Aureliella sp.]
MRRATNYLALMMLRRVQTLAGIRAEKLLIALDVVTIAVLANLCRASIWYKMVSQNLPANYPHPTNLMTRTSALLLLLFVACPMCVASDEIDFASEIQTVLARRCYSCHGPDQQEGSIRFDDRSTVVGEADSGEHAIVPGDPDSSELLRRVLSDDEGERMPPEGKPLTESEIVALRKWISSGAEYEQHWAFQPRTTPAVPPVESEWTLNSIDNFVIAKLQDNGLSPAGRASPTELIRRAYLDTTGLPPSPETVAELLTDWSPRSYQRLVDSLLADPAFGERWARNWLDVVRYAETNSFERDNPKPNVWKYRDYVIRAFNSDKPFDQFAREQLAGDELERVTDDSLTATGYYRLGIWDDEPADPAQAVFDGYDDLVTTTSQGFLGLTLNCARCHDHKIDPLTQKDYYSMVAFMRDVTPYGKRSDNFGNNQIDLRPELAEQYTKLDQRLKKLGREIRKLEQSIIVKMSSTDQRATEGPKRAEVLREKLESYTDAETYSEYKTLKAEQRELQSRRSQLPPREQVLGLAKLESQPPVTHLLMRGSPHAPGDEVQPTFPKLIGGGEPMLPEPGERSAGRRRVLADWIASDDNWLTSRVIANRVWQHYFGRGIVRSPNNFGLMGVPPTHPELLDHLASELVDSEWSLKSLHRKILMSATYQMSTEADSRAAEKDPENDLFWRQNLRRLSAEQVRDGVLAVTGQLSREQFGPSMYPLLSAEVLASQSRPGSGWRQSPESQRARRSIYIHVKRSLPVPLLVAFDYPETDISCEARFLTTQPAQALSMLNSDWMQTQAAHLAERIKREVGDRLADQAVRCLEIVLSRPDVNAADVSTLIDLNQKLQADFGLDEDAARRAMCLTALNLNAFLYIE